MNRKDFKLPPEYDGNRNGFLNWHDSFTLMLRTNSIKWGKVVDWLKSRKEKRIVDGAAKAEYEKIVEPDKYILENFDIFQRHMYRYLLDCTKG